MKTCLDCQVSKNIEEFVKKGKDLKGNQRYQPRCKPCYLKRHKEYSALNKDKRRAACQRYVAKNREKISEYVKACYHSNLEDSRKKQAKYKRCYRRRPSARLAANIRTRMWQALNKIDKPKSITKSLGCSWADFTHYIEAQFQSDMNWDNYGTRWELDHIRPLSSFDLTIPNQFSEACHFSNLQPLGVSENRKKSNKFYNDAPSADDL